MAICAAFLLALLLNYCARSSAIQFRLESKSKKCFREDIPLGTDALLTYTVAQGDGDMHVALRVTDMTGKVVYTRDSIDHDVFTFHSPDTIPGIRERDNWALRDDDRDEDDDAYFRKLPDGAGDDRVPYVFCFQDAPSMHLPRLSMRSQSPTRRIIFHVRSGAESKTREYYDELAKEKHLSSTEELFRVVEDRVSDVVRLIDEMRQRELRMDHLNVKTTSYVTWYCTLTCLSIALGAVYSSYATFKHLSREKVV